MFQSMKKAGSVGLVCLMVMSMILTAPVSKVKAAAGDATVNFANTKQSISGFGASSAWPVAGTNGWQTWDDAKCKVSGATGKHDVT